MLISDYRLTPVLTDLVYPRVSLQLPGEGAGAGHGLTEVNLTVARLPHLDDHRAPGRDVLTDVEETLHCRVHRDLTDRKMRYFPTEMTGSHHDWSVDGVLEGDVHRGVVGLVQLHLHLAVRHAVEADVKLDIHRVGHLDFHLEIQFCSSQL